MSILQIVGLVLELLVPALVGIILDRLLGIKALVVWLGVCLIGLGWLHWEQLKPLITRKRPPAAVRIQPPVPVQEPPPPQPTTKTPKLKPPQGKSQPPAQVFNSPDPYVGKPDSTVAMWAMQEADEIEMLGRKCQQDIIVAVRRQNNKIPVDPIHGFYSPEWVQVSFWNDYNSQHKGAVAKLHDSFVFRLGPIATESEEVEYKTLLDNTIQANTDPNRSSWLLCNEVQSYAPYLRKMAEILQVR